MAEKEKLGLGARLVIGGIAGFVATMAMTSAMRRLHRQLPAKERYPLTPSGTRRSIRPRRRRRTSFVAHFAYGAGCGALIAAANPRIGLPRRRGGGRRLVAGLLYGLAARAGVGPEPASGPARGDVARRPFRLGLGDRRSDARA